MPRCFCFFLFFCGGTSYGQMPKFSISAIQPDLAAYSKVQWNNLGFRKNPASGVHSSKNGISVLSMNHYFMPELSYCMVMGDTRFLDVHWAYALEHAGGGPMTEDQISLYSANRLGEKLSIGSSIDFDYSKFKGYRPSMKVAFGLALLFSLNAPLNGGIYFRDLIQWNSNPDVGGHYPYASLGLGYDVSQKFNLNLMIESLPDHSIKGRFAWRYDYQKAWIWQAGFSSSRSCFLGAGIRLHSVQIHFNCHYQPFLGGSPEISLIW